MVVCLCVSYTFVQGGHVRVDLVYSAVKHRTKRMIDMFGCLFFMMPAIVITYLYAWFFMWRHLMTPIRHLHQRSRPHADAVAHLPLERGDHRLQPERLQRLLPVQGADRPVLRPGLPAGGRVLLALLPGMGRGRGERGQVPGPRRIGDEAEELEHAIHSGST
jgi:hypothetical protein